MTISSLCDSQRTKLFHLTGDVPTLCSRGMVWVDLTGLQPDGCSKLYQQSVELSKHIQ